ncbi:enoyl-CoA hydratase/isomerase family protein [Nocardia sp. NPDC003345]
MDIDVRTLTAAEVAGDGARVATLDATSLLEPVLLVDLDGVDAPTAAAAAARVPEWGGLVLGVGSAPIRPELAPLTAALDLTYVTGPDPADRAVVGCDDASHAVGQFLDRVRRCPQASHIAAQVLRAGTDLPVPAAIDMESLAYSTLQGGAEFADWLTARRGLGRPLPPPPVTDPVLLDATGDTLRITLNRPERRNAYGTAVRDALVDALRVAVSAGFTRILLDGTGPSFCAGGDLDEFGHTPDIVTAHLIRTRGGAARLLARIADRTEARLHGHCVGAGIEIPALAGRVVAAPDTVFRLPEVAMGLIPGAGGTVSLPRRIGRWRALHLFITGVALGTERALVWGLIDEIADPAAGR